MADHTVEAATHAALALVASLITELRRKGVIDQHELGNIINGALRDVPYESSADAIRAVLRDIAVPPAS